MRFSQSIYRVSLTLTLAIAAALLAQWLRIPIPWMLGPLLCTAALSICGAPMQSSGHLRNVGQWVIACALGLYFTAEVGQLVVSLWWAILLGIAWALAIGFGFGLWLHRQNAKDMPELSAAQMRATSYFAGAIGGASEMTLMADRHQARTDLVAASHSMRLVLVVVCLPFGMQWFQSHWGLHVNSDMLPGPKIVQWPGLVYLALATSAGAMCMKALKRNNPWFMGPLVVSMGLTLMGVQWTAISAEMSCMAQLLIGVSLGVRFQKQFILTAPKWLFTVTLGTLGRRRSGGAAPSPRSAPAATSPAADSPAPAGRRAAAGGRLGLARQDYEASRSGDLATGDAAALRRRASAEVTE